MPTADETEVPHEEPIGLDKAVSLKEIFGEKLVDFRSMERTTRWITALGLAQIVAAVVLMGLSFLDLPTIEVSEYASVTIPLLLACQAFLVVAWTYLLVGALHARPLLRVPVFLVFLAVHLVASWSSIIWIAGLAWYAIRHARRPDRPYLRDIRNVGALLVLTYATPPAIGLIGGRVTDMFVYPVSLQVSMIALFLIPLIMFAGIDLGESVRDLSRWVIGQGAARMSRTWLVGTAVAICGAKLVWMAFRGDAGWHWLTAGVAMLLAVVVFVRMRPWEGIDPEPPFTMLFWLTVGPVAGVFLLTLAASSLPVVELGFGGGALAAGLLALRAGGADRGARSRKVYLAMFAVWTAVWFLASPAVWSGWLGLPRRVALNVIGLDGAGTALILLLLLLLISRGLATRAVATWAIAFTAGLSAIRLVVWVGGGGFQFPALVAAGQLVLVAAGLIWDVLTSGDKWTNGHSERVPRQARIFLYFGYVGLTVTALLFMKGTGQDAWYDTDRMTFVSLMLLGVPLYLYGFARVGICLIRRAATPGR